MPDTRYIGIYYTPSPDQIEHEQARDENYTKSLDGIVVGSSEPRLPSLAATCRESREEFRKHYFMIGGQWNDESRLNPPQIYYNPTVDIVVVGLGNFPTFIHSTLLGGVANPWKVVVPEGEDRGGHLIQRIALYHHIADDLFKCRYDDDWARKTVKGLSGLKEVLLFKSGPAVEKIRGHVVKERIPDDKMPIPPNWSLDWETMHKEIESWRTKSLEDWLGISVVYGADSHPVVKLVDFVTDEGLQLEPLSLLEVIASR